MCHVLFVPGDKQFVCPPGTYVYQGGGQTSSVWRGTNNLCVSVGGQTQYVGDKHLCYAGKYLFSAVGSLSSSVVSVLVTMHHCGTELALL